MDSKSKKLNNPARFSKVSLAKNDNSEKKVRTPSEKKERKTSVKELKEDSRFAILEDDKFKVAEGGGMDYARGLKRKEPKVKKDKKGVKPDPKASKFEWDIEDSSDEDPFLEGDLDIWNAGLEQESDMESLDEPTVRLALTNVVWDKIDAQDLLLLFSSLVRSALGLNLPSGSTPRESLKKLQETRGLEGERFIKSIKIYPSQFGTERMEKEKFDGPLIEYERFASELPLLGIQNAKDDEVNPAILAAQRDYQLKRSRYYFAVIECSAPHVADALNKEISGTDALFSTTTIELMFVKDDQEFDMLLEDCAEDIDVTHETADIIQNSLHHTGLVKMEIDEDSRRETTLAKLFTDDEIDQIDIDRYLAGVDDSSSEEEDEDTKTIQFELPTFLEKDNDNDSSSTSSSEELPDLASVFRRRDQLPAEQTSVPPQVNIRDDKSDDESDGSELDAPVEEEEDPKPKKKKMTEKAKTRFEIRRKRREKREREQFEKSSKITTTQVKRTLDDERFQELINSPARFKLDKDNSKFKDTEVSKTVTDEIRKKRKLNRV